MTFDGTLATRIRTSLGGRKDVVEKHMFGGVAFMVRGHMSCGVVGSSLMVRVNPDQEAKFLQELAVRPMDFTGRPMSGFLFVDPPGIASAAALWKWVGRATAHAEARPKKIKKGTSKTRRRVER